MENETYSVFYGNGGFFQLRTEFTSLEEANNFIQSDLFKIHGYKFDFILLDGTTLISGLLKDQTSKYIKDSMDFAIFIPVEEYLNPDSD